MGGLDRNSQAMPNPNLNPTPFFPNPRQNKAKDGPPEKQGSARGELAATLARVKGKPLRETGAFTF